MTNERRLIPPTDAEVEAFNAFESYLITKYPSLTDFPLGVTATMHAVLHEACHAAARGVRPPQPDPLLYWASQITPERYQELLFTDRPYSLNWLKFKPVPVNKAPSEAELIAAARFVEFSINIYPAIKDLPRSAYNAALVAMHEEAVAGKALSSFPSDPKLWARFLTTDTLQFILDNPPAKEKTQLEKDLDLCLAEGRK